MKTKIVLTFILALPQFVLAVSNMGRESGGGDAYALEFVEVAQQVSQHLKSAPGRQIDITALDEAIANTTVESTDQKLFLNNLPKDAINYPGEKKIVFNRQRWNQADVDTKPALVLHEYLGIMRVSDIGYAVSKQVLGAFRLSETPEAIFRRGTLATTRVFPTLHDRYTGDRGVGFIMVAEVATDAKSRNNKLLVIGLPDETSDWVSSTVDVSLDSVDSLRIEGTDLVVSGQLYDWNDDTMSPVEVRIQIKRTAGSDDYLSQLKLSK
ncbi:hypothetical protein D3C87_145640 [compost metagenome]